MHRANSRDAFTLIELMIVVIIIAALAAMVTPRWFQQLDFANEQIAKGDLKTIENQLAMYRLNVGTYPSTADGLDALLIQPASATGWRGPYLEKKPLDPWQHPYQYRSPGTHNASGFDLYSFGKDGLDGSGDEVANWDKK